MPIAFVVRCRPQNADLIDLVLETRRVFIGYPAWRDDADFDRHHLQHCLVNPSLPDDEWWPASEHIVDRHGWHTMNHNLARAVVKGSIARVPRPDRGLVYAAKTVGDFEIVDDPPWVEEYFRIRVDQGAGEGYGKQSHIGDVAQCWAVDEWRGLPYPAVPARIRRSLFGRSTFGRLQPLKLGRIGLDPFQTLGELIDGDPVRALPWTSDKDETERRLLHHIGPSTLEHLCVALLQLEHPGQSWIHVGGSGDGGVDGLGYNEVGEVKGVLQCKLEYWGQDLPLLHAEIGAQRFIAALAHPDDVEPPERATFLSRREIAKLEQDSNRLNRTGIPRGKVL